MLFIDVVQTVAFQYGRHFALCVFVRQVVCAGVFGNLLQCSYHGLALLVGFHQTVFGQTYATCTEEIHHDLGAILSLTCQQHGVDVAKVITHALREHGGYFGFDRGVLVSHCLAECVHNSRVFSG